MNDLLVCLGFSEEAFSTIFSCVCVCAFSSSPAVAVGSRLNSNGLVRFLLFLPRNLFGDLVF